MCELRGRLPDAVLIQRERHRWHGTLRGSDGVSRIRGRSESLPRGRSPSARDTSKPSSRCPEPRWRAVQKGCPAAGTGSAECRRPGPSGLGIGHLEQDDVVVERVFGPEGVGVVELRLRSGGTTRQRGSPTRIPVTASSNRQSPDWARPPTCVAAVRGAVSSFPAPWARQRWGRRPRVGSRGGTRSPDRRCGAPPRAGERPCPAG